MEATTMTDKTFWDTLLTKNEKGQTLYGLVQATCYAADAKYHISAQVPEAFPSREDLVGYALTQIRSKNILENFNPDLCGCAHRLPGYLKAQTVYELRHALQDSLRKKSVSLRGWETPEMLEAGVKYPNYTPAAHSGLMVAGETEDKEISVRGSEAKDWCGRCEWGATEASTPEQTTAFMENILWLLSPKEAYVMGMCASTEKLVTVSQRTGFTVEQIRSLQTQARKRLAAHGISAMTFANGGMV